MSLRPILAALLALALLALHPAWAAKPKPVYKYECTKSNQVFSYSKKQAHRCPLDKHKHYLQYVGTGR